MTPRVSICVPNLNMLPFLKERFDSIFGQSLSDWELFVYDSYSDDGAWEFIQDLGLKESRMRVVQGPREGPYPAWNECLRQTKAEFVYIATSDDTMASDCLEKMVLALERHPDCDLAHCPLVVLDEDGATVAEPRWPQSTVFGHGIAEMLHRPHVRRAPYDGLLHLTGQHVYLSMTQLLIRRSLFARIGGFPSKWGSVSDFNWEMKAGLVANTVHIPETWASWRLHGKQASASIDNFSLDRDRKIEDMIRNAIQTCEAYLSPSVLAGLRSRWLDLSSDLRSYYANLRLRRNAVRRRLFQLAQAFGGPAAARSQMIGTLVGRKKWVETAPTELRLWLESIGLGPVIQPE
jgi:glycosyltransferase involved in cell wall biosynthesis